MNTLPSPRENLWLQSQELYDRVVRYWANPPQPIPVSVSVERKVSNK